MTLKHRGFIDLPVHTGRGGFDHAAVHGRTRRLYVAHTANAAVDVIDLIAERYVTSITGLNAVAGALVAETPDLVFTSNRGENTVGIFSPSNDAVEKISVGLGPNGLAYDPGRGRLLVAHVGTRPSRTRARCRKSTSHAAGESPTSRWPDGRDGRCSIRAPMPFT
jgi:DNA-binding beta-propeller fold protein YncE